MQLALQISFQIIIHRFHVKIANFISVGNFLVRFYFTLVTYSIMDESLSLWLSLQLLLLSHISFHLLLTLQISFQLILPLGISSHFPLPCPAHYISEATSIFPNTPMPKGIKYISLFSPFSLSLSPPFSLSLCFSWLLVSLASTSFCGLASTDFSSGLASTGFFGFVLSGVLQKSFASY